MDLKIWLVDFACLIQKQSTTLKWITTRLFINEFTVLYILFQVWKKEDNSWRFISCNSSWVGKCFLAKSHCLHSSTFHDGLLHHWKYRLPICANVGICWASEKTTCRTDNIILSCSECIASWLLGPIRENLEDVDNLLFSAVHPDVSVFQVCPFSYKSKQL